MTGWIAERPAANRVDSVEWAPMEACPLSRSRRGAPAPAQEGRDIFVGHDTVAGGDRMTCVAGIVIFAGLEVDVSGLPEHFDGAIMESWTRTGIAAR